MPTENLVLSCEGCPVGPGDRCDDCLVTALTEGGHVLDPPTTAAVRVLQRSRLLPPLQSVPLA